MIDLRVTVLVMLYVWCEDRGWMVFFQWLLTWSCQCSPSASRWSDRQYLAMLWHTVVPQAIITEWRGACWTALPMLAVLIFGLLDTVSVFLCVLLLLSSSSSLFCSKMQRWQEHSVHAKWAGRSLINIESRPLSTSQKLQLFFVLLTYLYFLNKHIKKLQYICN